MLVLCSELFSATYWEIGNFCTISPRDFHQILVWFNIKVEEGHILHQGNEYNIINMSYHCIWLASKVKYTHIFGFISSLDKILNTISNEKSMAVRVTVLP